MQFKCTQAYTGGKLATKYSTPGAKLLVLVAYFSLGLKTISSSGNPTNSDSPEGRKSDDHRGDRAHYIALVTLLALILEGDPSRFKVDKAEINYVAIYFEGPNI
ncbi:hypothetical protein OnM2_082048 [Erysiphe neolycopersici]|uniref:Uncharacterized protein n=1 Tax=Erysiphe neolycopersici TaxID=212602 RepID=A0A420HFX3_9PEZI|nr:hypothetical protein OnM2_082048 [Erysiphe neolycopersici]